jgi:hypothetical protein
MSQIPELTQPMLQAYLAAVDTELPGFISAFYLQGSIALGAFNPRLSDLDFIAVLSCVASERQIAYLREIHTEIAKTYPHWPMQGSYLQMSDLGRNSGVMPFPYYHDGVLHTDGRIDSDDVNWDITWWLLKAHGIALKGAAPDELDYSVDWNALLTKLRRNLNTYWAAYTRNPSRMAWLLSDYGIQWTVLGVLRQFYSFRERAITSKTGAGAYGLTCLPPRWHRLIREAMQIREQGMGTLYPSRIMRALEAFQFLRTVIRICNADD